MTNMNNSEELVINTDVDLFNTLDSGQSFSWEKIDGITNSYKGYFKDTKLIVEEQEKTVKIKVLEGEYNSNLLEEFENYLGINPKSIDGYNSLVEDDAIKPVINMYPRLRILKQPKWECIVGFITSSCSNLPRIKLHMKSLRKINNLKFPNPYEITVIGESKLRELGFGFRAPYIVNMANHLHNEQIYLEELEKISYVEARNKLVEVKGIGRKIADCILAYSFNKTESFPVDRHVLNGLIRWYRFPKKITPEKASDRAMKKWGKISSYAQQYIFHRQRLASRATNWGGEHKKLAISSDIY